MASLGDAANPSRADKTSAETGNQNELHGNEVGMKCSALLSPPHRDQIVDFPTINHPSPSASTFSCPFHRCHVSLFSNVIFYSRQSRQLSQGNFGMLGKREQPRVALPAEVATGKVVPWEGCARLVFQALGGLEPGQFSRLPASGIQAVPGGKAESSRGDSAAFPQLMRESAGCGYN